MTDQSFPKRVRIRKRREFLKIYKEGKKIQSKYLIIHYMPNNLGHPRIGITVTKKVGKSVIRNRWKRLIREVFRKNRGKFPPYDIVITVKRGYTPPSYKELEEDLIGAVAGIG